MLQQRENGTNIDNWTFEELIAQVEIYKNMTKYQSTNLNSSRKPSLVQSTEVVVFKKKDPEVVVEEDVYSPNSPRNDTSKAKVIFLKEDEKKKHRYWLQIFPQNLKIQRKLKELYWLRVALQYEFPYYYLPPIKCVDHKKNFIQNFFDRLLDMRFVADSTAYQVFVDDERMGKVKLGLSFSQK